MNDHVSKKVVQAYNHLLKSTELLEYVRQNVENVDEMELVAALQTDICAVVDGYMDVFEKASLLTTKGRLDG